MRTHLLAVADALLFEAQFPLQVLDDGILGSLNVRIGDGARGLGDRGLLGERFAEETKQKRMSARALSQDTPILIGSRPMRAFQECLIFHQCSRNARIRGVGEGGGAEMKNDQPWEDGGASFMEGSPK